MDFLDLPTRLTRPELSKFNLWPVPVDLTTSWLGGTDKGPKAIISASSHLETYDEEFACIPVEKFGGIVTLPPFSQEYSHYKNYNKLLKSAAVIINKDQVLITLGGEHSITHPIVEAHQKVWEDVCVLTVDAHADLRDSYYGTKFNHACPMRRLMELGIHVTALGVRSVDESEADLLNGDLRRTFLDYEYRGRYTDTLNEIIDSLPSKNVYISIDLDGVNPAEMPAVGNPVPGGLSWYELNSIIKAVAARKNVIGADVVELSPVRRMHMAEAFAARLVYKMMSYIAG
jgi:agmatinase